MHIIMRCHDVGVKRYFAPFDTRLLRAFDPGIIRIVKEEEEYRLLSEINENK